MGVYFVMSVTEQEVKEQEKHLWNEGDEHIALPADADEDGDEPRGVVFVGRIPFGFFEEQLLEYFSQFGDITRLRLSRNKKVRTIFTLILIFKHFDQVLFFIYT